MKFITVKVPKNNEYSYEHAYAFFSSINETAERFSLLKILKKTKPKHMSLNILSLEQRIYFIIGSPDSKLVKLKNQLLGHYPTAKITNSNPIIFDSEHFTQLVLTQSDYFPIKTIANFNYVDPIASVLTSIS